MFSKTASQIADKVLEKLGRILPGSQSPFDRLRQGGFPKFNLGATNPMMGTGMGVNPLGRNRIQRALSTGPAIPRGVLQSMKVQGLKA